MQYFHNECDILNEDKVTALINIMSPYLTRRMKNNFSTVEYKYTEKTKFKFFGHWKRFKVDSFRCLLKKYYN